MENSVFLLADLVSLFAREGPEKQTSPFAYMRLLTARSTSHFRQLVTSLYVVKYTLLSFCSILFVLLPSSFLVPASFQSNLTLKCVLCPQKVINPCLSIVGDEKRDTSYLLSIYFFGSKSINT